MSTNKSKRPERTNNYKGKPNNRRKSNASEQKCEKDSRFTNDVSWYAATPELLRDSSSIPFSWAYGTTIDTNNPHFSTYEGDQFSKFVVPGICAMKLQPCFGRSVEYTSPISMASVSMKSFLSHNNSRTSKYDAPDIMLYLMSMTQIYSYLNFLIRTYGLATLYAQKNRYFPKAILQTAGIDVDDIVNNMAQFRYGINMLIRKAASFAVPSDINLFRRQAFLYSGVYTGGDSVKDQVYLYNPYSFMGYTLNDDSSGMLEELVFNASTVQEMIDFGTNLLDRLMFSEDINVMSGDVQQSFGGRIYKLSELAPDYVTPIIRDFVVLEQFKNATVLPTPLIENKVYQDDTHLYLKIDPTLYVTGADVWQDKAKAACSSVYAENRILTTVAGDPGPSNVMENTRLMCAATEWRKDGPDAEIHLHTGTEVAVECKFYDFNTDGQLRSSKMALMQHITLEDGNHDQSTVAPMRTVSIAGNFKFHPAMHVMFTREGSTAGSYNLLNAFFCYDVDNYAVITPQELSRIHEAALLSLVAVPGVGSLLH